MFEIDQYDRRLHRDAPASAAAPYSWSDDVAAISLMVWGEHCTECAAPACYKSCDLFEARPDTRCRRFRFGIYRNRQFQSLRGYGAEVAFKKWGVLAAMGNTAVAPRSRVLWLERFGGWSARALNALGPMISRMTQDERWVYPAFGISRRLTSWLHQRNKGRSKPDAFLLEVYSPSEQTVRMQLAMDYAPEARRQSAELVQIRPRFRTTVDFAPGYSRHEFDRKLFETFAETGLPFNITLTPEADSAVRLVFLTADFIRYRTPKTSGTSSRPPAIKCVVWDLDNTLWDGILVENDDVRPKENVRRILEALDRRGILCSIASKNTHDSAWRRLEQLGLAEYFLVPQINWSPKSESIRNITKRLNLDLNTFAFVDDNPFELNEVGMAIPEVECINVNDVDSLLAGERFQGSDTADARNRRRYYQEAFVREDTQAEFGDDYLRFLAHCEIQLGVRSYREEDFDRVAELVQRTNQLNFSGCKYDRAQLQEFLEDSGLEKYVLDCSDRFGAYGVIGFGMVRHSGDAIEVKDLMLSCRVQGKFVEQAFFTHLETHHRQGGTRRLAVNFVETKRNQPARQALEMAGLQRLENREGYGREIEERGAEAEIVRIHCDCCCEIPAVTS
ncbi:MAG TPA: HAD-IIIC family phosphatase [Bryobacteraceae bacterium]|nr:HAD-IIIC family phosphatase [Bryobacteraceae bacterium]